MNTTRFREWYWGKVRVADQLVSKHGSTAESDAEILLCCANSALAAMMWPGDTIDKFRFTQFLIDFVPQTAGVQRISIPVLVAKLRDNGDTASVQALINEFYPQSDGRILTGDEIDQPETAVITLLPNLSLRDVRESSYAGIIYTDLRCGLVHEYKVSTYLSSFRMSDKQNVPSYVNMLVEPDEGEINRIVRQFGISRSQARSAISKTVRHLYFPYLYIRNILKDAAEAAFDHWDTASSWKRPRPSSWWIRG